MFTTEVSKIYVHHEYMSFPSETNLPFLQDANFRNNMIKKIIQLL